MPNPDPTLDLSSAEWRAIDEKRKTAWIGADILIKGGIVCARDLTIDGKVDGTIEVGDHRLTIGVGAEIKADLVAKSVTISGAVIGNVTAREKVEVRDSGTVDGDIKTPTLRLADGAVVHGKVETEKKKPGLS